MSSYTEKCAQENKSLAEVSACMQREICAKEKKSVAEESACMQRDLKNKRKHHDSAVLYKKMDTNEFFLVNLDIKEDVRQKLDDIYKPSLRFKAIPGYLAVNLNTGNIFDVKKIDGKVTDLYLTGARWDGVFISETDLHNNEKFKKVSDLSEEDKTAAAEALVQALGYKKGKQIGPRKYYKCTGGTCTETTETTGNIFSRFGISTNSSASYIKDSEICDPNGFKLKDQLFFKCDGNNPQGGRKTRKSRKSRKSRKVQMKKSRKSRK